MSTDLSLTHGLVLSCLFNLIPVWQERDTGNLACMRESLETIGADIPIQISQNSFLSPRRMSGQSCTFLSTRHFKRSWRKGMFPITFKSAWDSQASSGCTGKFQYTPGIFYTEHIHRKWENACQRKLSLLPTVVITALVTRAYFCIVKT